MVPPRIVQIRRSGGYHKERSRVSGVRDCAKAATVDGAWKDGGRKKIQVSSSLRIDEQRRQEEQ